MAAVNGRPMERTVAAVDGGSTVEVCEAGFQACRNMPQRSRTYTDCSGMPQFAAEFKFLPPFTSQATRALAPPSQTHHTSHLRIERMGATRKWSGTGNRRQRWSAVLRPCGVNVS